jgi:hypothetical protein
MSSHILACFVNPMSWDALSSPCRGMSSPCRGMSSPCRGMSSPCQGMSSPCCSMPFTHIVACLAISWHVLSIPCRGMPCQAHVEACRAHVEACRARVKACQAHVEAIASQLLLIASKCFQVLKCPRPKSPRALVPVPVHARTHAGVF